MRQAFRCTAGLGGHGIHRWHGVGHEVLQDRGGATPQEVPLEVLPKMQWHMLKIT